MNGAWSGLEILSQVLVALGLVLPTVLAGLFARRRSTADAEVTLSAEARKWAEWFAAGATSANEAAQHAMEKLQETQERAVQAETAAEHHHNELRMMEQRVAHLETILHQHGIPIPARPENDVVG